MDLEKISAELRPRAPWEAIDLGISLARRHLGKLFLLWCLSVLPVLVLLTYLLGPENRLLVPLVFWLKPLFDRVPLYYLSRALFGSAPTVREFLRALPKLWTRRFFDALIASRISLTRSLVLPIKELEGFSKNHYPTRRDALKQTCYGQAHWFTVLCLALEFLLSFALIIFVGSALPSITPPDPWTYLSSIFQWVFLGDMTISTAVIVGILAAWFAALWFVGMLYTAGGFGLYLNARTELEGWDVELAFRRIGNRIRKLQGTLSTLLVGSLIALFLLGSSPRASAASDPVDTPPDEAIQTILEHEDFEIHTRTEERRVQSDSNSGPEIRNPDGIASFVGAVGKVLFWAVVITIVVLIIVIVIKNRHLFKGRGSVSKKQDVIPQARTVLGMRITKESLPDDVVAAAREAWLAGRRKESLSLLYRGALSWLVLHARAPISESDTEQDCLTHAQTALQTQETIHYLESLTHQWIIVAYGEDEPLDHDVHRLFDAWPFSSPSSHG